MGVLDIARQLRPALYQPAQNKLVHGSPVKLISRESNTGSIAAR
jgi:hypothetical protein